MLGDSSDASLTKRLAGTIFIIRVFSAGLAYFSQVLLARWMGSSEYGIYVYAWTWVLLLGSMMDFGIAVTAQKLIPEYRGKNQLNLLRGFLFGSRWMTFGVSIVTSCLLAGSSICCRHGSTRTRSGRSMSAARSFPRSCSPTCRTASPAPTTGCGWR